MSRVGRLCPGTSDLDFLGNGQGIIDLDPKVSDGTSVKIAGPPIDHGSP